jgi:hypothetical protein
MSSDPARSGDPAADLLDRAAMGVSLVCMAHCLAVPLALTLVPSVIPALWDDQLVHVTALALALPLALFGIGSSLRRVRDPAVLTLATVGLVLMAAGIALHDAPPLDVILTLLGAGTVGSAHLRNYLLRRRA